MQRPIDKQQSSDVRWQVVKAMIDEFPELKEKIAKYIN
jgi:hypothetical protein